MRAKLIRVIPEEEGMPYYFRQYEYECIECGGHFTRHQYNDRIDPYCGPCRNKHDRIRQKERRKTKDREKVNRVLDKIRAEIEQITDTMGVSYNQYISKIDVLQIIDKYKAGSEDKK